MKAILDRIEFNAQGKKILVFECDDKERIISEDNAPKNFINDVRQGDIVECDFCEDSIVRASILVEESNKRRENLKERLKGLFNRGK